LSSKSSKKNDPQRPAQLIPLGRLVNTHGVRGELRLLPYAFPCHTLKKDITVFLQNQHGQTQSYTVEGSRPRAPFMLVRLGGVDSLEQAQALREAIVAVEETFLPPLQEGEFYYYQVIGLQVRTVSGEEVGVIAQVFFSGGHDIWVVRQGKKEYLIPVTEEIVRIINIAGGYVTIEPLAGLLE
jgi:16S rRNA processing protein RimM